MYEEAMTQIMEGDAVRWGNPRHKVRDKMRTKHYLRELADDMRKRQSNLTDAQKAAIEKQWVH